MPSVIITARSVLRALAKSCGLQLQRIAPNQIRGIEPLSDIEFLLKDTQAPVIFDVGANDGETVAAFLQRFKDAHVVAVEPFKLCYEKLAIRFAQSRGVKIVNMAFGDVSGEAQLNLYSGDRMNSILELSNHPENLMKGLQKSGSAPIKVETLDRYCQINAIHKIDVLKIDTQGYDLNVLRGAPTMLSQKRIKVILVEINFAPMYSHQGTFTELHTLLSSAGYRLVDFYNHVWKNGHTAWCDACYVAPNPVDDAAKAQHRS